MKAKQLTRETIGYLGMTQRSFPEFGIGDTIAVTQRIVEGDKERLQVFEGYVIAIRKQGVSSTFTVRKIGANSIAVEKIFPHFSPRIESIKFIRKGDVRRAKLFYLRDRVGKKAMIKEKVVKRGQTAQAKSSEKAAK